MQQLKQNSEQCTSQVHEFKESDKYVNFIQDNKKDLVYIGKSCNNAKRMYEHEDQLVVWYKNNQLDSANYYFNYAKLITPDIHNIETILIKQF